MPERIISVAGQPGSGKTTLVNYLEREHGFAPIRPSRIIRNWAEGKGIVLGADRQLWANARREIGAERGQDWLTQAIANTSAERVALDGLRTLGDYKELTYTAKTGLARVAFVGLFCPVEIRFKNTMAGEEFDKDKPPTLEEFRAQELPEYYSDEEYGVATQTVLDLTPPELRFEYDTASIDEVQSLVVAQLGIRGFLES